MATCRGQERRLLPQNNLGLTDPANEMMIEPIQTAFHAAMSTIDRGPIYPNVTAEEVRDHLRSHYAFDQPIPLERVAADVEEMLRQWQVQVTHPRYFGLFNPSVTSASVIADAIVATYNPQLASWRTSPAANEIERHTLAWLAAKFGLPPRAAATFTQGGAESNLSAVIAALTHSFPGYGENGLRSLPATPTIYLSEEAHHSFNKIVHMTGLGRNSLRPIPTDRNLKMDNGKLAMQIETDRNSGSIPFMVVGTAGTTAAGIIDPLAEIAEICHEQHLWFHADAAWGGAAILAPSLRGYLAGIEQADSISCDAHKWLSVSMACGMFFCRHRDAVTEAFRADAAYMPSSAGDSTFDPYTSSVQWSRRFIGLKLFMSLAERGEHGQSAMIEHQARMGTLLRQFLVAAGWTVVNSTPLPVICFTREDVDIQAFLVAIREHQVAWMSEARIGGTPVVRACITSFKTTESDIQDVVEKITRLT
jgi:glutamate/tyrosine decarboxylase-like PLP-dependent enzyme